MFFTQASVSKLRSGSHVHATVKTELISLLRAAVFAVRANTGGDVRQALCRDTASVGNILSERQSESIKHASAYRERGSSQRALVRTSGLRLILAAALALLATPALAQSRSVINVSGLEYNGGKPGARAYFDYAPPSDATLASIKANRFWAIRLPISEETLQPDPVKAAAGTLDETYLAAVLDASTRAQKVGLSVIVDLHNYGRYYGNPVNVTGTTPATNIRPMYINVVAALAKRLQAAGVWGFAVANEPHDIADADVQSVEQDAVNAARAAGFRGYLFVENTGWAQPGKIYVTVKDPMPSGKTCYDVHAYGDGNNSGTYKQTMAQDGTDADTIVNRLKPSVEQAKSEGRCLFVGELGAPLADAGRRTQVLHAAEYLRSNGIDWALWTAGEWSSNDPNSLQPGLAQPALNGGQILLSAMPANR